MASDPTTAARPIAPGSAAEGVKKGGEGEPAAAAATVVAAPPASLHASLSVLKESKGGSIAPSLTDAIAG